MAYFAAAIAFLLAGTASVACGFGLLTESVGAPETLAVVHMICAGWLGLLFCGALLQFVPVLAATSLRLPWLAGPALLAMLAGIALLVTGFLALGGRTNVDPRVLMAGAVLLGFGFLLVCVALAATILSQKAFGFSGSLVLIALIALVVTISSGNGFAALLSGVFADDIFLPRLQGLVPLHAGSGLLGWMTLTAIGVSYRLFAMFMLAPEQQRSRKALAVVASLAIVTLLLTFALAGAGVEGQGMGLAAACLAATVAVLYVFDIRTMFLARRRRALELNSLAGLVSLGFFVSGMAMLAFAQLRPVDPPLGVAAFYVLALGWLSGLGLAQLYKIVPFLTWLETYGPVMGRSAVPRVQDLVDESSARAWFALFFLSVAVGAGSILTGSDLGLRVAASAQFIAVLALAIEYLRARLLANVPEQLRLPPGAVRPHLIFATIKE